MAPGLVSRVTAGQFDLGPPLTPHTARGRCLALSLPLRGSGFLVVFSGSSHEWGGREPGWARLAHSSGRSPHVGHICVFRSLVSLEPSGIQLQGKQEPWERKYMQTLKLRVPRRTPDAPRTHYGCTSQGSPETQQEEAGGGFGSRLAQVFKKPGRLLPASWGPGGLVG